MDDRLSELEEAVSQALITILERAQVASVHVRPDDEDDDRLRVVVEIAESHEPLPNDVLLKIVNVSSDAIQQAGERRFPLVFGRFAEMQEFAA